MSSGRQQFPENPIDYRYREFPTDRNDYDEVSTDEGSAGSLSDEDPEQQDHESDIFSADECSESDSDKNQTISGRTWAYVLPKSEPGSSACLSQNGTLTGKSENVESIEECFRLFVDERIVDTIVMYTNRKAEEFYRPKASNSWKPVHRTEMYAFFGLLLLIGRFRESRESKHHLWRRNIALTRPIYTAIMSRDRFESILKFIRFEDWNTREQRRSTDKLAPLRLITDLFASNCRQNYDASSSGTIDEQLMNFGGRCSFKVCMPSKPGKFGIKLWTLCDSYSYYCCNFQVHLAETGENTEGEQARSIVKELVDFWKHSGRIITTGNTLTDISLAEELFSEKLFLVGTMRKDRADLPRTILKTYTRAKYSSHFLFTPEITLVSYVPMPRKSVLLLSTMHHGHDISGPSANFKPEILTYCNATKSAVRRFDELLGEHTCRRQNRRWTLSLFMHYLDVAAYNAFVIWLTKNPTWTGNSSIAVRRRMFLEELGLQLSSKHIDNRVTEMENGMTVLHRHVADAILATGRKIRKCKDAVINARKRARCYVCISSNNKYRARCDKCEKHVCAIHSIEERSVLCVFCSEPE